MSPSEYRSPHGPGQLNGMPGDLSGLGRMRTNMIRASVVAAVLVTAGISTCVGAVVKSCDNDAGHPDAHAIETLE